MILLGCIGESSFVFAVGGGAARIMTVDDDEVVLSNAHPLDPALGDELDPCPGDPQVALDLAELVLREGVSEGTGFPGENVAVLARAEAARRTRIPG